ncbi:hypothetical protein PMPD1_4120 [Paramixta manurensis]|uniref:DUF805 domain-containing protein n=1 Tax=Paramixta manurensis TaxID=2740817 RepID=A0A6M8UEP9_9GAMM|nr:hypothetical protein PMPD1_4120 [Erwiniaceae bacterium PD-1]
MTLQQWCFSWRGRIGRRDFWIWQGIWLAAMVLLFIAADRGWLTTQNAAFGVVCLLWPSSSVVVKRLHDRNRKGYWGLLLIVAWMLLAANLDMLDGTLQWALGRFLPALIFIMLLLDLGVFSGSAGDNRFGPPAEPVNFLGKSARVDYQ